MKKNYHYNLISFCLALALLTPAFIANAQNTLYDNGLLFNSTGTGAGGANESILYSTSLGMGTIGFGAQQFAFNRVADDFTISDCKWNVDSIVFFCYQTNSTTMSTITAINFRIWDGFPEDAASTLVYGDTTNNFLTSTTWSGVYRVIETTSGSTARPIMRNVCAVPGLTLNGGNFWIDWSYAGTLGSGPWAPPIVILNTSTTGNGMQKTTSGWNSALDGGIGSPQQGFPFIIYGSVPHTFGTDTRTECNSYTWIDGNTYTTSNNTATFNIVGGAANGCDSLVTLDLTINNSTTGTDTRTECNSYTWIDGNTYTTSNNTATFNIVGGAANGCDSLVTLNLTINNSTTGTDTRTECNSYTWIDGNTYTSSNNTATFSIVGGAANGCDSLVTLNLTINNSTTGTDVRTECNSYTWIDGNTYTSSNNTATFNIVGGASNGCDSLVTLNLTINNSTTGTDTRTECNSYTWIDGNTYTSSNNTATFNIVGGAANGCDSLVTLNLIINNVSDLNTSISGLTISAINTNATYQWLDCNNNYSLIPAAASQSFTAIANGNYAVELTENGCVDTSACVSISNVSLADNSFGNGLIISPNPTSGKYSIDMGATYDYAQISIMDVLGKLLDSYIFVRSQILNLSMEHPAGVYFISIQTDNKKAVVRLVKH